MKDVVVLPALFEQQVWGDDEPWIDPALVRCPQPGDDWPGVFVHYAFNDSRPMGRAENFHVDDGGALRADLVLGEDMPTWGHPGIAGHIEEDGAIFLESIGITDRPQPSMRMRYLAKPLYEMQEDEEEPICAPGRAPLRREED